MQDLTTQGDHIHEEGGGSKLQEELVYDLDLLCLHEEKCRVEVGTLCSGAVFLIRVQDNFIVLRGRWMQPPAIKSWMRSSFSQLEH